MTTAESVDFKTAPAIIDCPVQSAICDPTPGSKVMQDKNGKVHVRGYAWSGGGRKIIRVDVSGDGGQSWQNASLNQNETGLYNAWAWTLWEVSGRSVINCLEFQNLLIYCVICPSRSIYRHKSMRMEKIDYN